MSEGAAQHSTAQASGGYDACRRCRASLLCQFATHPVPGITVIKRQRRLRRGEILYSQGDAFEALYSVCSGTVRTSVPTAQGRRQTLGFCIPGELVGIADLSARRHTTDAVALEPTEVAAFAFRSVSDAMDALPLLRRIVLQLLAEQLAHDEELILPLLGKKTALERLSAYLLSLSRRYEARGFSATYFPLAMSRSDISDYLGLAKETVCRLLARLTDDGLITLDARRLRIRDHERLAQLVYGTSPV
jgi:CRP/FNR family transcriptional regulator